MAKFNYTTRADGRLVKKVTHNKEPIYLYSYDPKDLENQYIKLKNDINFNKKIIKKNNYTIEQYANYYYKQYIQNSTLSNKTKKDYNDCIRLYINPYIGNYKLYDMQEANITTWLQKLSAIGLTRRREMSLQLLNSMFKKALKNNLLSDNPASDIKLEKHVAKERKPLSLDLINFILDMPDDLDDSVFMIKFIITTGLRLEEVSPLEKSDILKKERMLDVGKVVDLDSKNLQITYYTKNKDKREVPILNIIYDSLINRINSSSNNLIFPNTKGQLKSRSSFRRDLERFLKILNKYYEDEQKKIDENFVLEKEISFTYHQLRYSYARLLHKADVDLKEAQNFTGHKDLSVLLNVYTKLDEEDIQKASNKLNAFFNPDKKLSEKLSS